MGVAGGGAGGGCLGAGGVRERVVWVRQGCGRGLFGCGGGRTMKVITHIFQLNLHQTPDPAGAQSAVSFLFIKGRSRYR
eukprot:1175365-Prorocentrum_minimum.AAC.2